MVDQNITCVKNIFIAITVDVYCLCLQIEALEDPIEPVEAILNRCNKSQVMQKYCVGDIISYNCGNILYEIKTYTFFRKASNICEVFSSICGKNNFR